MKRKRMGIRWVFVLVLGLVVGLSSVAQATPVPTITWKLDYGLEWGGTKEEPVSDVCGSSYPSFGTITLSDNGNGVDVNVDLLGNSIHKIQKLTFNYDDARFGSGDIFTISAYSIEADENKIKANGYKGDFDLQIPETGNLGTEPFTATISAKRGGFPMDLNPSDFNFTDSLDKYLAVVHVGDFGGLPGVGGGDSLWVAASAGGQGGQVPIPAPMLLLGSGLVGLAFNRRKR